VFLDAFILAGAAAPMKFVVALVVDQVATVPAGATRHGRHASVMVSVMPFGTTKTWVSIQTMTTMTTN